MDNIGRRGQDPHTYMYMYVHMCIDTKAIAKRLFFKVLAYPFDFTK